MKLHTKLFVAAMIVAGSAAYLVAQDADGPGPGQRPPGGPGGPGGRMPPPPLMAALDANHDGMIDSTEIDNASAALRKLDKNGDGQLTMEELRPPGRGPGGPGGPNGQGPRRRGPGGPNGSRPPGNFGGPDQPQFQPPPEN